MNQVFAQGQATPAIHKLTCVRCRNQVPSSTLLMTADGPVCERCPAT